jgi:putative oxidoreductase
MISLASSSVREGGLGSLAVGVRGWLGRFPKPILELMGRLGVAGVFWRSGLTKIDSWETTVALFREEYALPVLPPETAAYLGTAAELVCPILIAFGLGARFGAAALLGMTLVIQTFVYPGNWPEHLLWASVLTYVLTRGAGVLSFDHVLARRWLGVARGRS